MAAVYLNKIILIFKSYQVTTVIYFYHWVFIKQHHSAVAENYNYQLREKTGAEELIVTRQYYVIFMICPYYPNCVVCCLVTLDSLSFYSTTSRHYTYTIHRVLNEVNTIANFIIIIIVNKVR